MKTFRKGERVIIDLPTDNAVEANICRSLREYDGRETVITKRKNIYAKTAYSSSKLSGTYYECEGVVSEYGIPFSLADDWLQKVKA